MSKKEPNLRQVAKTVRERLGIDQLVMARELDIEWQTLMEFESNEALYTEQLNAILANFKDNLGLDLISIKWCWHADLSMLPSAVQAAAKALADSWENQLTTLAARLIKS